MKRKILWITRTGLLLGLLVALQALTKPMGQLVTGSCVNLILAIAALVGGLPSGLVVALISPVLAYLVGIAPQVLTVPAIMVGNCAYVLVLWAVADRGGVLRRAGGLLAAAAVKCGVLYVIVAGLICGVLADQLLSAGLLKPPMLQALPTAFGITQLVTALIGGSIALLILPVLRKALRK